MAVYKRERLKNVKGEYIVTPSMTDMVYHVDGETVEEKHNELKNKINETNAQLSHIEKINKLSSDDLEESILQNSKILTLEKNKEYVLNKRLDISDDYFILDGYGAIVQNHKINIENKNTVIIRGVIFKDVAGIALGCHNCHNIQIIDCEFHQCGVQVSASNNVKIENNEFFGDYAKYNADQFNIIDLIDITNVLVSNNYLNCENVYRHIKVGNSINHVKFDENTQIYLAESVTEKLTIINNTFIGSMRGKKQSIDFYNGCEKIIITYNKFDLTSNDTDGYLNYVIEGKNFGVAPFNAVTNAQNEVIIKDNIIDAESEGVIHVSSLYGFKEKFGDYNVKDNCVIRICDNIITVKQSSLFQVDCIMIKGAIIADISNNSIMIQNPHGWSYGIAVKNNKTNKVSGNILTGGGGIIVRKTQVVHDIQSTEDNINTLINGNTVTIGNSAYCFAVSSEAGSAIELLSVSSNIFDAKDGIVSIIDSKVRKLFYKGNLIATTHSSGGRIVGLDNVDKYIVDSEYIGNNIFHQNYMPTKGTYQKGTICLNDGVWTEGDEAVIGWLRLTTGSEHIKNVDWKVLKI